MVFINTLNDFDLPVIAPNGGARLRTQMSRITAVSSGNNTISIFPAVIQDVHPTETTVMAIPGAQMVSNVGLEDFSFATHQSFWNAFVVAAQGADEPDVRKALPTIEIQLTFGYEAGEALGTLNEFVIDLDPACTEALVVARYALRDGKVSELFADLSVPDEKASPNQIE